MTDITLDGIREAAGDDVARGPGGVCVGRPTATTRVRISALDATGAAIGELSEEPQVTGEIVVSAPHVKDHYDRLWLTDQAATRQVTPGERWHRTGDVGHLDAAGRLWVEGRLPHVITTAAGVVTPVGSGAGRVGTCRASSRAAAVGVGPAGTQQVVIVVETIPRRRPGRRWPTPPSPKTCARSPATRSPPCSSFRSCPPTSGTTPRSTAPGWPAGPTASSPARGCTRP